VRICSYTFSNASFLIFFGGLAFFSASPSDASAAGAAAGAGPKSSSSLDDSSSAGRFPEAEAEADIERYRSFLKEHEDGQYNYRFTDIDIYAYEEIFAER
jgi:hypothetical protein